MGKRLVGCQALECGECRIECRISDNGPVSIEHKSLNLKLTALLGWKSRPNVDFLWLRQSKRAASPKLCTPARKPGALGPLAIPSLSLTYDPGSLQSATRGLGTEWGGGQFRTRVDNLGYAAMKCGLVSTEVGRY